MHIPLLCDDPYTYMCGFFHGTVNYTPPPHQQGRRKSPQDGMSAKAWEKEEKLGLFPQAFTTKTHALRHGTPLGGADTCPKTQVQIHTTCFQLVTQFKRKQETCCLNKLISSIKEDGHARSFAAPHIHPYAYKCVSLPIAQ